MNSTSSEDAIRDELHRAAEAITPGEDLFDRVRSGVRRRRNRRTSAGLATLVLLAAGFTVVRAASPTPPPTVAISGVGWLPPKCASVIHNAAPSAPSGHAGANKVLVPGTPVAATVCDYQAAPGPDVAAAGVLRRTIPLTGDKLAVVVSDLQKPLHVYGYYCMEIGPFFRLTIIEFRYSTGPDVDVYLHVVCTNLSNGSISGAFQPNATLPSAIEELTQ